MTLSSTSAAMALCESSGMIVLGVGALVPNVRVDLRIACSDSEGLFKAVEVWTGCQFVVLALLIIAAAFKGMRPLVLRLEIAGALAVVAAIAALRRPILCGGSRVNALVVYPWAAATLYYCAKVEDHHLGGGTKGSEEDEDDVADDVLQDEEVGSSRRHDVSSMLWDKATSKAGEVLKGTKAK